jgi:hypothetical protein
MQSIPNLPDDDSLSNDRNESQVPWNNLINTPILTLTPTHLMILVAEVKHVMVAGHTHTLNVIF